MAIGTRKAKFVWLVGHVAENVPSNKLPTWRESVRRYFKLHNDENKTKREAATQTVREVFEVWKKARIPTMEERNAISKFEGHIDKYRTILKGKNRRSDKSLDKLFDVAHKKALSLIDIQQDKDFLNAQREPCRRGIMVGIDKVLAAKEARFVQHQERIEQTLINAQQDVDETVQLESGSSSCGRDSTTDEEDYEIPAKRRRASEEIMNPDLAAALDRTKVTDRAAVYLVSATATALGHDPADLIINRSSFRRSRQQHRLSIARSIRDSFAPEVKLVVHWDGKLLPDDDGIEKVDILPVVVTGVGGVSKLLGVPKLPAGTGQAVTTAVMQCIEEWGISDQIVGMSFDTTSSNTGSVLGACTLLQQELERELLQFACRHHILELVAQAAFTTCFGPSSGPDISIFKRFQKKWPFIDQAKYDPMTDEDMDANIASLFYSQKEGVIHFCQEQLSSKSPRDDYRELLELTIVLFGGEPARGIRFYKPGALHQARWMARVIYGFKIFLFRPQFQVSPQEETAIKRFCVFIGIVYIKHWFTATNVIAAPAQDLALLKKLISYPDKEISNSTSKKFARHLWYLSESIVSLAFFDPDVAVETKRMMVEALQVEASHNPSPRAIVDLSAKDQILKKTLADFVSHASFSLFDMFELPKGFLCQDPPEWLKMPEFCSAQYHASAISAVNDFAERGVAMVQEYGQILTKDEDQRQFLLQVVEWHRKQHPTAQKVTSSDI